MKIPSGMTRREALKWAAKIATIGIITPKSFGASSALLAAAHRRNTGFSPLNLPGLLVWYDATQQTEANGAEVVTLTDFSGNGNNMNRLSAGQGPTMVVGSSVNGKRAFSFDGTNDEVIGSFSAGNNFSIFWLAAVTGFRTFMDSAPYAAGTFRSQNDGTGNWQLEIQSADPAVSTSYDVDTAAVYHVDVSVAPNRSVTAYINNSILNSGSGSATAVNWSFPRIGSQNGSQYMTGLLVEVIICNQVLSSTDRAKAVDYLKTIGGL